MAGGIEEGIETIMPRCAEDVSQPPVSGSSNKGDTSPLQLPEDPVDEYEVSSPGRMKPRGVLFGCLGLGLAAAIMGVGVVIGRSFNKEANASQVSTAASQAWEFDFQQEDSSKSSSTRFGSERIASRSSKSAKKHCDPDLFSNVCEGIEYYKLVGASDIGVDRRDTIAWTTFLEATLPGGPLQNCVMAPVNEMTAGSDLKNIAIAAGTNKNSYVGVRKSARNVFRDNSGNGSQNNWFNLDETPVPSGSFVWAQANNAGGLEAYAYFETDSANTQTGGKLDDIEDFPKRSDGTKFNKAVMKCCGDIPKTFCPA